MRQQYREFLAAQAAHQVGLPQACLAGFGCLEQDAIAGSVAETVIDQFEPVEIEDDAGQ